MFWFLPVELKREIFLAKRIEDVDAASEIFKFKMFVWYSYTRGKVLPQTIEDRFPCVCLL